VTFLLTYRVIFATMKVATFTYRDEWRSGSMLAFSPGHGNELAQAAVSFDSYPPRMATTLFPGADQSF
jgi:hypothetical protein